MTSSLDVGHIGPMNNDSSVGQYGPMDNGIPLGHSGTEESPQAHALDTASFFVRLLVALGGDYASAAAIALLLRRKADLAFVGASTRDMSGRIGELVPRRTLSRAVERLADMGLLERQVHPNTTTEIRINCEALRALLAQPLPSSAVLPGITPLDDALARIFGQPTETTQEGETSNG